MLGLFRAQRREHLQPVRLCHLHDAECKCKLGHGGNGEVKLYQCKEEGKGKSCCDQYFVVKILRYPHYTWMSSEEKDKICKRTLLNEYSIGMMMNHRNIVRTLDVDLKANSLIFEFFKSIELTEVLHNAFINKFPTRPMMKYFKQLTEAVKYMHSLGVAHLDIKPQNILVDMETGLLKLIDFGSAIVFKVDGLDTSNCDIVRGTPSYLPPEVLGKDSCMLDKVDVWSCGVVLYNIVYNQMPWKAADRGDYRFFHCQIYLNRKELSPSVFPDISEKGFDEISSGIVHDLFIGMLQSNPLSRSSIEHVSQMLMTLEEEIGRRDDPLAFFRQSGEMRRPIRN